MRFISKLLAGIVFGLIAGIAAAPFGAAFDSDGSVGASVILVVFAATLVICLLPGRARAGWGRGSLIVGLLFFALPISMTMLSARAGSEVVEEARVQAVADSRDAELAQGAAAVGAGLGAGLMVGASGFFGFFMGTIFVVLGVVFLLGGRREVIVVNERRLA